MPADQEFPLKLCRKSFSVIQIFSLPNGTLEKSVTLRPCIGLKIFIGKIEGDWPNTNPRKNRIANAHGLFSDNSDWS